MYYQMEYKRLLQLHQFLPVFLVIRLHTLFQPNNNTSRYSSDQIEIIPTMKLHYIILSLNGIACLPSTLAAPALDADNTQMTSNLGVEKLMSRSDLF